jgi:hypothetical protein
MRRAVWIAALAALVAPAVAQAKGPVRAKICGAVGCERAQVDLKGFWPTGGVVSQPGPDSTGPPFLTLKLTSPGLHFHYRYVPSLRLLRCDYGNGNGAYWRAAPPEVIALLKPYVRRLGLKP